MEKNIKNFLLDYAAHHAVSCEFIHSKAVTTHKVGVGRRDSSYAPNGLSTCGLRGWEFYSYKQKHMLNSLANGLLLLDKVLKNQGSLLVCSQSDLQLQLYAAFRRQHKSAQVNNPSSLVHKGFPATKHPSFLLGGWMGGACSNWSSLSKVAWNSHRLLELTNTLDSTKRQLNFRADYNLLQLRLNPRKTGLLAYKHKPDCVLLINPTSAAVRECKSLSIPLCILSSSPCPKISGSYLESNQESCFLTYLIINLMSRNC